MKPDILFAYEKARKVVETMTYGTSRNAWLYIMFFRDMFGVSNFYTNALREAWFSKMQSFKHK